MCLSVCGRVEGKVGGVGCGSGISGVDGSVYGGW